MKITHIHSGFVPLFWALQESARIEREVADAPTAPIDPAIDEVHDDAPMRIADILRLPEFRGALFDHTLRAAIDRGQLRHERHGRRIVVTPAAVREWREKCQSPVAPVSGSSQPNLQAEGSESIPSGSSKTVASASSLDALKATAKRLSKRSRNT